MWQVTGFTIPARADTCAFVGHGEFMLAFVPAERNRDPPRAVLACIGGELVDDQPDGEDLVLRNAGFIGPDDLDLGIENAGEAWLPTMSSTTFMSWPCIALVKPAKSRPGLGRCSSSL